MTNLGPVVRTIDGFHADDAGDYVAELSCGHSQHVRHNPPFAPRPWVLDAPGRASRVGGPLECPLCTRGELPDAMTEVTRLGPFHRPAIPAALLERHVLARHHWAVLTVTAGTATVVFEGRAAVQVVAGRTLAIPPALPHHLEPSDDVACSITVMALDR